MTPSSRCAWLCLAVAVQLAAAGGASAKPPVISVTAKELLTAAHNKTRVAVPLAAASLRLERFDAILLRIVGLLARQCTRAAPCEVSATVMKVERTLVEKKVIKELVAEIEGGSLLKLTLIGCAGTMCQYKARRVRRPPQAGAGDDCNLRGPLGLVVANFWEKSPVICTRSGGKVPFTHIYFPAVPPIPCTGSPCKDAPNKPCKKKCVLAPDCLCLAASTALIIPIYTLPEANDMQYNPGEFCELKFTTSERNGLTGKVWLECDDTPPLS